jgi:hypothetical protein
MGDKNKMELSAFLQSKKFLEQSEKIFDQEMKNGVPTTDLKNSQIRVGTAYSARSVNDSELMDDNDPMA